MSILRKYIARYSNHIYLLCSVMLLLISCKKNNVDNKTLSGKYTGKFVYADNGIVYNHGEGYAEITFNEGNYNAINQLYSPNETLYGVYHATVDTISFNVGNPIPGTLQSTRFLLTGYYNYHFEGDSLIITRNYQPYSFNQYRLKKN